ncbi:MAG: RNA 2',3'-cyclic phosphodiesterase [Planctomycetaceae bacterium]|nr:RNA 2',3'-cyclic phosphodiesterase [Planctomycetaceae bacterium]
MNAAVARTFIAVPIPDFDHSGLRKPLRKVLNDLELLNPSGPSEHRSLRVTPFAQLHITLKFLGDTPVEMFSRIESAIQQTADAAEPFECRFPGLGTFPNADRPTVVWSRIEPEARFRQAAQALDQALQPEFQPEKRPYQPHLTLARIKGRAPASLGVFLREHAEAALGTLAVDQIVLVRSILETTGAKYEILKTFPLHRSTGAVND